MKLIYCNNCQDVFRLVKTTNTCQCGESGGHYKEDGLNVIIHGNCKPLGFSNASFCASLEDQPEHGAGSIFTAFVIPKVCPTVDHVDSEDYLPNYSRYGWSKLDEEHESTMEQADADRKIKREFTKDEFQPGVDHITKKIKNVFRDEE